MTECTSFLEAWTQDPNAVKPAFARLKAVLEQCGEAELSFKARPGITYSLRGACPGHDRDLFVMVDVVDDDPADRWLSVCFYDDQVTDPEDRGDWAPGGLGGQDARCFNIDEEDAAAVAYVEARIREAWQAAQAAA